MSKYNLFQGDYRIKKVVGECLGVSDPANLPFGSGKFYFEAFFYLSKRFGQPEVWGEYEDAGAWNFSVKDFTIQVLIDSTFVRFMIFGDKKTHHTSCLQTPYMVAYAREQTRNSDKLFAFSETLTPKQKEVNESIIDEFLEKEGIDIDLWTEEEWEKSGMQEKLDDFVFTYNDRISEVKQSDYERFGDYHYNAETRRALSVLRQFLHNMLTPIWIRDVPYNILGVGGTEYMKYEGNIEITLKQ